MYNLQVAASDLNYEMNTSLSVVIRCTDTGIPTLYDDRKFTIQILDVNEAPDRIIMTGGKFPENTAAGVVAKFYTIDPDDQLTTREVIT